MTKTTTKEQQPREILGAALLSAADCARLCGVSRRTWFRLTASGKTPASVRVGGSPRWRRSDLDTWISLGCADRREFEARKGAEKC